MNIDWENIEGFREDMTAEERLALLDNYTPSAPTEPEKAQEQTAPTEPTGKPASTQAAPKAAPKAAARPGYIPKADFDKVSSELAAAKRQLRSRMSEDEQREADRQAEIAAREEELKSLRREKTLSMHKASFMGLSLDEKLADEAATALVDGDSDALFDALKRYQVGYEKALRAKILAETPKPPASTDPNGEEAKKQDAANLRRYFGLST